MNRLFVAVLAARLTSNFGTFLSMMALNVYMLELTGSAVWMGLTLAVKVVSGILSAPVIGWVVDRFDRRRLMVLSDAVLAAAMLALVFMPPAALRAYIVFLMMLSGVFSTLIEVALNAATPVILGTKDTLRANSWLMGGRNLVVAASALCAVAAGWLFKGYTEIFILDALTYLVSAGVLLTLPIATTESRPERRGAGGFLRGLREDFAAVERLPNARTILLFLAILLLDTFASGSHNVGWPVFSRALRPDKPMLFYGVILFFWALGNVAGIYRLNRTAWVRTLRPETLYLLFTGLMSLGMLLTFQTTAPWFIAASAFLAGVGDGTYQTYLTTYLQGVPDEVRGKVFALNGLAVRTGFSVGFVAAPLAIEAASVRATALLFHGAVLLVVAGTWAVLSRRRAPPPNPA